MCIRDRCLAIEEKKAYLRQVVGTSVELEDGTGWVKDEKSIALSAFDRANNPNRPPTTFSPELKEAILDAHNLPGDTDFNQAFAGWSKKFDEHYLNDNEWLFYLVKEWTPFQAQKQTSNHQC